MSQINAVPICHFKGTKQTKNVNETETFASFFQRFWYLKTTGTLHSKDQHM